MRPEAGPNARIAEGKGLDAPMLRDAARSHIDRLLGVLRDEDKIYKHLLSLSQDLHEAVLKRDVDGLSSITRRTGELTERISQLEKERLSTLEGWAPGLGLPSVPPTIKDIAEAMDNPEAKELAELRDRLVSHIKQLNEANKKNIDLIRATLKLINASITYMAGFLQSTPTYGRDGQQARAAPQIRAIVDRQA